MSSRDSRNSVVSPLTEFNLASRNNHHHKIKPFRRDSRSTINYSEISEKSTGSLWKRSISASNEAKGSVRYKHLLARRFEDADPMKEHGGKMSHLWEMVNRILNQPMGGDDESIPWLQTLLQENPMEATHKSDNSPPYWTLLHKACFYGAPRCTALLVSSGGNLHARDDAGNSPLDLARFGQSPAHRDISEQLHEAMEQWRANEELRKVIEAKQRAEALLEEEDEEFLSDDMLSDEVNDVNDDVEEIDVTTVNTKRAEKKVTTFTQQKDEQDSKEATIARKSIFGSLFSNPFKSTTTAVEDEKINKNKAEGLITPSSPPKGRNRLGKVDDDSVVSGGGDWGSLGSAGFSTATKEVSSLVTPTSSYTRGENGSVDTSVRQGKRLPKAKVGAQSRFVNHQIRTDNEAREVRNRKLTTEIHKTDFRCGTYNADLLPHVAKTIDALSSTIDALDPRLAKHLSQDNVDEEGEYKTEANVVHGEMTVDRYLSESAGPGANRLQAGPRPKTTPKVPTYGGSYVKPTPGSRQGSRPNTQGGSIGGGSVRSSGGHSRPSSSPMSSNGRRTSSSKDSVVANTIAPHLSLSAKRRSDIDVAASRSQASELRFREAASVLTEPGWVSGSQLAQSTLLYKEARASGSVADSAMADIARLGRDAPLGWGSHSYRIGGSNEHSADKRLTALTALKEQRMKRWWKNNAN